MDHLQQRFDGPFAYTTEEYVNHLDLPVGPTYGVMVDAKTILTADMPIEDAINALFVPAAESKIGLVRVAAHFHEVEKSGPIVEQLADMGYIVGYNLMQAGGKPNEVIEQKAQLAAGWKGLSALYFADSLGNMDAAEVTRITRAIKAHWAGPMGIHTHNNMSKAIDNTFTAIAEGVSWVDVTVTGMGRGAGNAQTENLLAVLAAQGNTTYKPEPVYELVVRYFESMQKDYGWGSSLLYFLGAQNDVHPTYIQNLLSNTHYGTEEIVGAISYLSTLEGTSSYSGDVLEAALNINAEAKPVTGSSDLKSKFAGKEVLLISDGPSLGRYLDAIKLYIKERSPVVIAVNTVPTLDAEFIDYHCVSHNTKFLSEGESYGALRKPLILPAHRFTEKELSILSVPYVDYGVEVAADQFECKGQSAVIPFDLTFAYALSAAKEAGAAAINLIGADGYGATDPRQQEMLKLLSVYKRDTNNEVALKALTPTSYPVIKGSIYAPAI